jgi:hypothetical protein
VCPLAPAWEGAAHLQGEKVCHYLLQTRKAGTTEYHAGRADGPVFLAVLAMAPAVCARHRDVEKKVTRAGRSPLRGERNAGKRPRTGVQGHGGPAETTHGPG